MKNFCIAAGIALALCTTQVFGSEAGMPQLNPEFWSAQIFWLVIIFSILYVIIWKIFLPKVTDSIENRKLRIVNDLNETQKLKESAEKKLIEYNKIIEDAKKEARKILEINKKKLESDIKTKKQTFDKEIEKELMATEKEVKELRKTSISNINKVATEISSEIIRSLMRSEVNMSNVSAVVDDVSKKKLEKFI